MAQCFCGMKCLSGSASAFGVNRSWFSSQKNDMIRIESDVCLLISPETCRWSLSFSAGIAGLGV